MADPQRGATQTPIAHAHRRASRVTAGLTGGRRARTIAWGRSGLPWAREADRLPVLLGRQSLLTPAGRGVAYELLYRSAGPRRRPVDRWSVRDQDEATRRVVQAALHCGLEALAGTRPVFVNATRSLLLGELVPPLPVQVGVEVLESVEVDAAVLAAVRALRARGHLVAVDDFVGSADQVRLLPHADLVKVDVRDLARLGPGLLQLARSWGALTVAEHVEDTATLQRCRELGFDLVQGNLLEPALVLDVSAPYPRAADATLSTALSTANTGSRPAPLTSASA